MSKALATNKVAAALLGLGVGLAFAGTAFAQTTSDASTLATLQAQVQALLAQIAALQGTGTATTGSGACFTFTQDEWQGQSGGQVMWIQEFLNGHGYTIAASGAGSPGNETSYFGGLTKAAVQKFQSSNGITPVSGYWGPLSRAKANAICAGQTTTGTGTTTPPPTTGSVTVTAGTQPANSLAPMKAARVPFTTFTISNNSGAAVTINGVTVQRTGLANDNAFAGVILVDSNGLQYGNAQTFNSNHQATVGGTFTMQAGQSITFTVAGNMELSALGNAGQVASISVTGVNTTVPVTGTLPITGAQQTINESLTIGTANISNSGYDPNGTRSEAIGTTGVTFSAIRITANNEDQKLYSVTWNETGSAGSTDLSNLVTVVNGTSYPVTVDASGKYFTSTFPGGILISKGNSADVYIKGDITGSNASGRTVEFDIYRASDIYIVGQTYGYGITPTFTTSGAAFTSSGNNSSSGFQQSANPSYFGSYVNVTGGTLSTVSSASSVPPANIGVNVSNQILGGFTTNFTGEPVTVQSLTVHVATSSGATQLQNVTLVDQNGNTVAGPDDETLSNQTIVFNSSITFPTGSMTYTIKGTVATGATNGSTYVLSTNPRTDWSNAVGQTSGTSLTLTNSLITMSTMTVQPGALTISASASPTAQTITANQNNFVLANIVLDASQSGEDVRLNSLPIVVVGTSTDATNSNNPDNLASNLTNCQLYNGSTVLNSQAVGTSQWTAKTNLAANAQLGGSTDGIEANFTFDNSLTVTKGTTLTLSLECNVGGSVVGGETFAAGVDTSYAPTVTGATSGNSITTGGNGLTVNSGTSGTMTVGTASITVATPSQNYQTVAAGTQGVVVGSFTLQPTTGNVTLQSLSLKLNSNYASSSDLQNGAVTIWNGSTQVGTVSFNGLTPNGGIYTSATTTLSTSVPLSQGQPTTLTLKANTSALGTSGKSGHELIVGLNDAHGVAGNTSADSGPGTMPSTAGSGTGIYKSYPTVAQVTPPNTSFSSGYLIEFSITASSGGDVGIGKLTFDIASTTGVTISNTQLFYGTTQGVLPSTAILNNGVNATTCDGLTTCTTTLATPLDIGQGQTWYFLLKTTPVYNGSNSVTPHIQTTLLGDGTDLAPNTFASSTISASNFIWTPYSTTTVNAATSNDWTNGFPASTNGGLPSFGISQNDQ